jgi:hypothetical protein
MATDHFAEFQEARYEEDVIVEREAHEDGEGHGRDDTARGMSPRIFTPLCHIGKV